ncbi:hypothetical protein L9F63_017641, partial [Diploptera punctata]
RQKKKRRERERMRKNPPLKFRKISAVRWPASQNFKVIGQYYREGTDVRKNTCRLRTSDPQIVSFDLFSRFEQSKQKHRPTHFQEPDYNNVCIFMNSSGGWLWHLNPQACHLNTPATLFVELQKMDHYSQTISPRKFKFCTYLKAIPYIDVSISGSGSSSSLSLCESSNSRISSSPESSLYKIFTNSSSVRHFSFAKISLTHKEQRDNEKQIRLHWRLDTSLGEEFHVLHTKPTQYLGAEYKRVSLNALTGLR